MFGNAVKFERLNMCEWFRFSKARDFLQGGSGTGTDDHVRAAQQTLGPVGERDLHGSRSDEPTGPSQNQYRTRVSVVFQIHLVEAGYHFAFALADARHVDCEAVERDAKLFASANVGRDLRAVDDVLARQTGDVRAGSANVFAIDYCDPFSFPSKRPRSNCRTRATTENDQIKLFGLHIPVYLSKGKSLSCSLCDCSFLSGDCPPTKPF